MSSVGTDIDYSAIVNRIKNVYNTMSAEEKAYLRLILEELSEYGYSNTYNEVWLSDYKEIPVDIDTFIESDYYLGRTNRNGQGVYPYWREVMTDLFTSGNKYEEVILTGATRIGKTSTAITCVAYMLYRLMCLRDPQKYFGKKEISKFSVLFFNITKELASGVAFREFNDTLKASPWFNAHGTFSKSEQNFYYIPEGGKITIDFGSDASHGLGKQVFCLVGGTEIITDMGIKKLADLADKSIEVLQYNPEIRGFEFVPTTVKLTKSVTNTVKITLSSGLTVECTPEHRLMMFDGKYKEAGQISKESDEILCLTEFDGVGRIENIEEVNYEAPIPVYDVIDAKPLHNFIIVDHNHAIVSHNCAVMDECNFSKAGIKDVAKAKAHMQDVYNTISARIKGTFRKGGEVYGKLFAVSSKRSDSDFMELYVQNQLQAGAGEHMYISDQPQWKVLPPSMFTHGTFTIAVGDRFHKGFVVPDNQNNEQSLNELLQQGYILMHPPTEMRSDFLADFDIALRDLAGVSVPGALSFITQETITKCIGTRKNPFFNDILQIGTQDNYSIEEFFHSEVVDAKYKHLPMYIHLDLSLVTDKTGISGVVVSGNKDIELDDGKKVTMPTFTHIFSVAIEAPRGDKIPYSKIMKFIFWLRSQGYNIKCITRDQFQSEYLAQLLEEQHFTTDKISLDRTPDGYMALRSVFFEQRIDLLDCQLLQDELIHLQRDAVTGRIDHPVGGCFTGDTKVRLIDGRSPTILELLEEQDTRTNWVYTVNEATLEIEIRRIEKVFQTKIADKLIQVNLSNGKYATCTPEHRFMLNDGVYCEAKDLQSGDRLMTYSDGVWVLSVVEIAGNCPVYDLTIEDNPNFALDVGVFVHNSKDTADSLAGAVWKAITDNPGINLPISNTVSVISAVNGGRGRYGGSTNRYGGRTSGKSSIFPTLR